MIARLRINNYKNKSHMQYLGGIQPSDYFIYNILVSQLPSWFVAIGGRDCY